ncbi:MAG TPA: DUF2461 domain-containing protein [Mycobacteriales bacterium]|nr:DUF2461 domain-containing protein [Mycobacteriales bacterium]
MTFSGIPIAALDFYEDLEADNTKTFWNANKAVYEESVKAPMLELAALLGPEFGEGKFFRPYRDIRFSKDKTPYKTHQGVVFHDSSRYVQISAAGLWVGGGYWHTTSAQVGRMRRAIDDDLSGKALENAIATVRKSGLTINGEQLTRVPSGFEKEHPRADLLRYKSLTCGRDFGSPAWLSTKKAHTEVVKAWRSMTPLIDWLAKYVGQD